MQLNDTLMLTDIITHLKDIMTMSGTAIKESNCEKMRNLLTKTSSRVAENQFAVFKFMNESGMYPVDNAEPQKVIQSVKRFSPTIRA